MRFYEGIGLSRETLGFHIQTKEELAHYARACTDILFKFPFSKKDENGNVTGDELEGIAARSDFDLSPAPAIFRQADGRVRRGIARRVGEIAEGKTG